MKAAGTNLVLIIDEDSRAVEKLSLKLGHADYITQAVHAAADGLKHARTNTYAAIILNREFSDGSGMDICKALRENGIATPILMICGTSERVDVIRCLELGADDCLRVPYSYNELIARLGALLRRHNKTFVSRWVRKNDIELDVENCTVHTGSLSLALTKKETLLLKRLMHEAPNAVSRFDLLQDVWEIDNLHTSNRLDVYVKRVRNKLQSIGKIDYIKTARGRGYYINLD